MVNIELLTQETIDKIAAGEVVEKPASVVKELVENSIDAKSTSITVEILKGGLESIRITDNGIGIPDDQIEIAFLRHSTSKIRTIDDLNQIKSLGFRGEALSSISAVSKVELITKTVDKMLASHYIYEGAKEIEHGQIGAPLGTTFFVRSLFFNTPARKKFLKSASTEASYVVDVVEHLALSNPNISFQLLVDHKTKFTTVGNGSLSDTIYQIYGREIAKALIPVEYEDEFACIHGFIGDSTVARGNRSLENFFVNGRFIKSKLLSSAVENSYSGKVMQHQYPFTCLFIDFKNDGVDVNVHPTKMEVRFFDNDRVYSLLYEAVYDALYSKEDIRIESLEEDKNIDEDIIAKTINEALNIKAEPFESTRDNIKAIVSESIREDYEYVSNIHNSNLINETQKANIVSEEVNTSIEEEENIPKNVAYSQESFLDEKSVSRHRIIGQVFDTYWLVEFNSKLYIIDQHAAHEKILFENTMKAIEKKEMSSQLISPSIIVSLSAQEEEVYKTYSEEFEKIGYSIEHFGGREFAINAVPGNVFSIDYKSLFYDLLNNCMELKGSNSDLILERVASMSCKAAVKGRDHLSYEEASTLIEQLLSCEDPYHCPHGRPTIIAMTKYEIEKKFKRVI